MLKLPAWKYLRAGTSTADAIGEQLAEMDRAHAAADAELSRLAAARPALLLDVTAGADAKLEKHDNEAAAARRVMEATGARRAALEDQWRQAEAAETTARVDRERRDRYAAASKARTEGARLLTEYDREAAALAGKLRRLAEIEAQIVEANADLPDDFPPVPAAELFNGRVHEPDLWPEVVEWIDLDGNSRGVAQPGQAPPAPGYTRRTRLAFTSIPGAPGFPHRPLGSRVGLPAVDPTAPPHWSGAPTVAVPRHPGLLGGLMPFRGARA